ncbi:IS66 family insertion sequence element accessory protein TnpB [Methylocystis sp.]|uniref:IS66 family insertion sequence element accessory protein TnpB n=1 Tax=Methylocystis sp. TaxID=1911079 RepID=UPI003D131E4F
MLQFAPGVKVYLACKPVDMRRGFDGLAADVAQVLRADPYSGMHWAPALAVNNATASR